MKPVAVDIHPRANEPDRRSRVFFGAEGRAVETPQALREVFEHAETFAKAVMKRNRGAGFMRSLLLQRICSSELAGLTTARAFASGNPREKQG